MTKVLALNTLCETEGLEKDQFGKLIETYIYTERGPLRDEVIAPAF